MTETLPQLLSGLAASPQRHLLVVAGSEAWTLQQAQAVAGPGWCWLSPRADAPTGASATSPERPAQLLGGEWQGVVLDAWAELRPDLLAAAAGTVRRGGILLLLAPPLAGWGERAPLAGFFWQRLRRLVDDPEVLRLEEGGPLPSIEASAPPPPDDPFAEQRRAVAEIVRSARGRAQRPLLLIADRGRGKSAALGLAAAQLLAGAERPIRIVATAPRADACANLLAFAARALDLPAGTRIATANGELRYLPPHEAVHSAPDLLLVDEAAALPVAMLQQLLGAAPRLVFASTVHGYEGSGRGFELRFVPWLERAAPRWRRLALQRPLRWEPDDRLERWLYRALLLDAAAVPGAAAQAPLRFESVGQAQLALDEPLLRQLFALLVQAHYRTTPDDLRDLLQSPQAMLWLARRGDQVVAALWLTAEGELPTSLHDAISRGERRPRGNLLPQSLAFHAGEPWALGLRGARVVRLAVLPAARRGGVGSALLGAARQWLQGRGYDWLGVSFSATVEGLAFWRHGGMQLLRVGTQRETTSGEYAAQLGQALSERAAAPLAGGACRCSEELAWALADHLRELEPALVCALLRSAAAPTAVDPGRLDEFVRGKRPLEGSIGLLGAACRGALASGAGQQLAPLERDALVMRLLQLQPWPQLVRQLRLKGSGEAQRLVRAALGRLLTANSTPPVQTEE